MISFDMLHNNYIPIIFFNKIFVFSFLMIKYVPMSCNVIIGCVDIVTHICESFLCGEETKVYDPFFLLRIVPPLQFLSEQRSSTVLRSCAEWRAEFTNVPEAWVNWSLQHIGDPLCFSYLLLYQ